MSLRRGITIALAFIVFLALPASKAGAAEPRVAIWDPVHEGTNNRFELDLAGLDQVTNWLKQAHVSADRLTAEQLANPAIFSAKHYDAALFIGNAFPLRRPRRPQTVCRRRWRPDRPRRRCSFSHLPGPPSRRRVGFVAAGSRGSPGKPATSSKCWACRTNTRRGTCRTREPSTPPPRFSGGIFRKRPISTAGFPVDGSFP